MTNVSQAEINKFGALANRRWGESMRLRESSGLSRIDERPARDGRAGALRQGWLGARK